MSSGMANYGPTGSPSNQTSRLHFDDEKCPHCAEVGNHKILKRNWFRVIFKCGKCKKEWRLGLVTGNIKRL